MECQDGCSPSCALTDILNIDRLRLRPNGIRMTERELVALSHQIREDAKLCLNVVGPKRAEDLRDRSRKPPPRKSGQGIRLRVCFRPLQGRQETGELARSGVIQYLPKGRLKPVSMTWEVSSKSTRNLT